MEDPALFDQKKFETPKPEHDTVEPVEDIVTESEQDIDTAQAEPVRDKSSRSEDHPNFKAMRDKLNRLEQERDAAMQKLAQAEQTKSPEEPDEDIAIGPDDIAEGKHISKVVKKMKKMEAQLQQYQRQSAETIAEAQIKVKYPDFDAVVNRENIEALRVLHPEIAATINSNPDLYTKASAAYKMIKQLGIQQEDTFSADRERVQKNAAKPRPINSVASQGDSPLAKADAFANGLTDDVRAQLLKEMNQFRKNF